MTLMSFSDVVNVIVGEANKVITILSVLVVIIFFASLIRFVYVSGDEKNIQKNKSMILWSLVALFIIFSLWGVLQLMCNTFFGAGCGAGSALPSGGAGLG